MKHRSSSRSAQVLIGIAVLNTVALVVLAVVLLGRMNTATQRTVERQDRLIQEIRRTSAETEDLRQAARALIEDTGEIRGQLGMRPREYEPLRSRGADSPPEDGADSAEARAFFEAFRELLAHQNSIELRRKFHALRDQGVFERAARELGLQVQSRKNDEVGERLLLLRDGETEFTVELDEPGGTLRVKSQRDDADAFAVGLGEKFDYDKLSAYLSAELAALEREQERRAERIAQVQALADSSALRRRVEERAHVLRSADRLGSYEIALRLENNAAHQLPSMVFGYQPAADRFVIDGDRYDDFDAFRLALFDEVSRLEDRPPESAGVQRSVEMLERAGRDRGFQRLLENEGLRLSQQPRDRGDHIHFDLYYKDSGERFGSFAVQRPYGELWVMDDGDVPLQSFRQFGLSRARGGNTSFDPALDGLETISTPDDAVTAVVMGTNEGIADSIMLAHADPSRASIKLISVPRDLFYRGRRLNIVYPTYGPERFARELTEITGLAIDHFVAVDMYAFIEVVNILGGVEVELEEDLIDPSYRTRDDGEWGTLYYPRGTHQLSGVEALRVARSRATTDDFDRASRQQRVVSAVFEKLSKLQLQDLGTLHELIGMLTRYVDTDLSPIQTIRYIQRFAGFEIGVRKVLDTSNVLYHTYSNLYYSQQSADEVDDDFDRGAWILLPVGDDWSNVRRYVEQVLNGEEA